MPSDAELAVRLLVAAVLGGAIGLERELADKYAGLRTHISVALGSCLFAIVSAYSFDHFGDIPRDDSSYSVDVTRIASYVAAGIGFIGGGTIVKHGGSVRGLTTAGSLWVAAAVGLASGFGRWFLAAVTTGVLLLALVGLQRPARWLDQRRARDRGRVLVALSDDADPGAVLNGLRDLPGLVVESVRVREHDGRLVVDADVRATERGAAVAPLLGPIDQRADVDHVEVS